MSSLLKSPVLRALPAGTRAPRYETMQGILFMLAATAVFSVSDATAKYLTQAMPVMEIAWIRYVTFVVLTWPPALRHGPAGLATRRPWLQLLRGLAIVGSALLFISGVRTLPLADATALSFAAPLIITALSVPVLGETVGPRRWIAVSIGLIGVLLVVQPGTGAFQPAAALPLLSAVLWAVGMILTRQLAPTDSATATLAWTALTGLVVSSALLPFSFAVPSPTQIALGVLIGVVSTAGQGFVALAYRAAAASVIAPFSYAQLITSTLLGLVLFGARPGPATLLGAAVIAASGLYVAHRERRSEPC
jgi:drug/metabolite transporter (DMT)-like permease